jgi:hypothetical protein
MLAAMTVYSRNNVQERVAKKQWGIDTHAELPGSFPDSGNNDERA